MKALIFGITGQDGSYLAESLVREEVEVHGVVRRRSPLRYIRHLIEAKTVTLHTGDVTDQSSLDQIISSVQPDEVFGLAAMSFVGASWQVPEHTMEVTGMGTLRLMEAVRKHAPRARVYQAASSEQFGASPPPQNEETPFYPRSPYGIAKVMAFHTVRNHRESYGLHAVSGILGNHESPRRGIEFVTRKISRAVARIYLGQQEKLLLGDLKAERDWGWAPEYVEAMKLILRAPEPRDYVVGTGVSHSVEDFAREAFGVVDLNFRDHVEVDPKLVRLAEVRHLRADASKIKAELGWEPRVSFEQLVREMVLADIEIEKHRERGEPEDA